MYNLWLRRAQFFLPKAVKFPMFSLQFNLQSRSENLARSQNFPNLEKSACIRDHKANKERGGPKELWTNIFALGPVQDPRKPYLSPRRAINRFTVP